MAAQAEIIDERITARQRERIFYTGMAVLLLITVLTGFGRTYFLRPVFQTQPLVPLLHLHGLLFTSWIVLMLVQTGLIATKRTRIHMRLGIAGGVLATLMIIVGSFTAIVRAKLIEVPPGAGNPLQFLTIPLGDMVVFAILVGAALYFRRQVDTHKRLMLIATIGLMPAAIARFPHPFFQQGGPLVFFGLSDLLLVPLLIFDLVTRGRPHKATMLGGALLIISHPLRLIIGGTSAWLAFATWITQWS
jgi:hypothetical protein